VPGLQGLVIDAGDNTRNKRAVHAQYTHTKVGYIALSARYIDTTVEITLLLG